MSGVAIEIQGLSKSYGAIRVVDDVSLNIMPGEFIALLGPSGSGKSTLLMSVAGFVRPSSGSIKIGGKDVTHIAPRQRNIGMVFQKYALFPHMTVRENIAFPLLQRRLAKDEIARRIASITELVGLGDFEGRLIPDLSGGQQQRVALARALVYQPPVLLMDEPLGALDKKLREHLQQEIKQIQRITGTTVIFVTHDQTEALAMADRLVVFRKGRIEQIGTPSDLYDAPQTAFVADFIGEANILKGTVREINAQHCQVQLESGCVIAGKHVGDPAPVVGNPVDIVVRPAHIFTGPCDGSGLHGTVIARSYLGESVNLRVALKCGDTLAVKEPPGSSRQPGEEVSLNWHCQHARVFKTNERGT